MAIWAPFPGAGLRTGSGGAENRAVRTGARSAAAVASLCVCLAAMAQNCMAQSREPDPAIAYKTFYKAYAATSVTTSSSDDRVDINRASLDQLLKVHGMTPSWAGRIVRFRPYHTKRDLLEHGVVTSEVYDRVKDSIIAHREPR